MSKKKKFIDSTSIDYKVAIDGDDNDLNDLAKSLCRVRKGNSRRWLARIFASICLIILGTTILVSHTSANQVINAVKILKGGRYLVLLANNAELRPGGGFIGSFAILNTRELMPKVEYFETNIYKADNEFTANNFVAMPEPLAENLGSDKSWQLHDSNWSADFPTAAKTSLWFYANEYHDELDGVILVCATSVRDILALTGPISAPNTNITLDYDNFFPVLTSAVEKEYWDDPRNEEINEPKSVLKDYIPPLEDKIQSLPKWQLFSFFKRAVDRKDILFYSNNSLKQQILVDNNLAGEIDSNSNFIYIANATLGTKTSLSIKQDVTYNINSDDVSSLNITRTHNGQLNSYDGGVNTNYTIVHLPKELDVAGVKVDDKEIDFDKESYNNYNTFGFWTNLEPGKTTNISMSIFAPKEYKFDSLKIIKQPGSANETFDLIVDNSPVLSPTPLDHDLSVDF